MTKKLTTRKITKSEAHTYLKKAEQFHRAMIEASSREDWDAAGLTAIHCVISANDALLGLRHGLRPVGKNHAEAAEVLMQYEQGEDVKRNASRFDRMVKKKNLVEYEGRVLTAAEGRKLISDAERFLSWVEDKVK